MTLLYKAITYTSLATGILLSTMFYAEHYPVSTVFLLSMWFIGFAWFPVILHFWQVNVNDTRSQLMKDLWEEIRQGAKVMYFVIVIHQALFHVMIMTDLVPDKIFGWLVSTLALLIVLASSNQIAKAVSP